MSTKSKSERVPFPITETVESQDYPSNLPGAELPKDNGSTTVINPIGGATLNPTTLVPFPPIFHLCHLSLPQGCYALNITNTPTSGGSPFILVNRSFKLGTLRVENTNGNYTISGDTYRYSFFDLLFGGGIPSFAPPTIPVYPRGRYGSYLKVTAVSIPSISISTCKIHLTVQEFDYTQPPAGSYNGTFPAAPSRTMDIYLSAVTPPVGYTGVYFSGEIYIGGVLQSNLSMSLGWISPMFRRAKVLMHTMAGSVAPSPVGGEYLDTIYAKANWQLTVANGSNPAVPAGITATNCWAASDLHNAMTGLSDYPGVNLDTEWTVHVLVVQAKLGCGRGVMFDTINVPREGVATFCEDGYPSGESAWFGAAANHKQKDTPRAFLRSCTHEITHGFNQIHQEQEGGADNSIMTTTPSVSDTIHAAGGTFPTDIKLDFNEHVRHHLRHLPDIVIRPGGMTFGAGHNGIVIPTSDNDEGADTLVEHPSLKLTVTAKKARVKIGEPVNVGWELQNIGKDAMIGPNNVSMAYDFADLSITKPDGSEMDYPPFVLVCDGSQLAEFKPGEKRASQNNIFWCTEGFAFDTPGKHNVNVEISWRNNGQKIGASGSVTVLVDYPVNENDNDVIANMMDESVGKFIALGGHAYHIKEAVARISNVVGLYKDHAVSQRLKDFYETKAPAKAPAKAKAKA